MTTPSIGWRRARDQNGPERQPKAELSSLHLPLPLSGRMPVPRGLKRSRGDTDARGLSPTLVLAGGRPSSYFLFLW